MGKPGSNSNLNSTSANTYSLFGKDDTQFWNLYNKLGEQYRQQLDPMLQYTYDDGLWDRIGDAVGFRTGQDAYRNDLQNQARQMMLSLYNDQFQNDYNSAQAKASRERAAGLNPDLTGTESGAPAAQMDQPLQPASDLLKPPFGPADLPNLLGSAVSSLQSVATFGKMMAEIKNVKSVTTGQDITDMDKAFDYVGKWLSAKDPTSYKVDLNTLEGRDKLAESLTNDYFSEIKVFGKDTRGLLKKAFMQRLTDPKVLDDWYSGKFKAMQSRFGAMAGEGVYGALDQAESLVRILNDENLSYMENTLRFDLEYQEAKKWYDLIEVGNDTKYEEFRQKYKIPETVAYADYLTYLANQKDVDSKKAAAEAKLHLIQQLRKEVDEKDNAVARWYLQGMSTGVYAPLGQYTGSISGPFGVGFKGSASAPVGTVTGALNGFGPELPANVDGDHSPYYGQNGVNK